MEATWKFLLSLSLALTLSCAPQPIADDRGVAVAGMLPSGPARRESYCDESRLRRLEGWRCSSDLEEAARVHGQLRDVKLAACCAEISIETGNRDGYWTLARILLLRDDKFEIPEGRVDQAILALLEGTEAGSGLAAELLVELLLYSPVGTSDTFAVAESALRSAESQGHVEVAPSLAYVLLQKGLAGEFEAIEMLEKWSGRGDVESSYLLGEILYVRAGDLPSKEEALHYTRRSAAAGHERSRVRLAIHALDGDMSRTEREAALATVERFLGPGVDRMLESIDAYDTTASLLTRDALRVLQRVAAESAEGAEVDGAGNED